MRLIPVMLALLLALSPGAVAFQASAPAPTAGATHSAEDRTAGVQTETVQTPPSENTTDVLTLGSGPAQAAFDSPSLSLGSSLAMDHDEFRTELSVSALDQQLENADSPEKKKQILNRYRYRIENRIISLKAEERRMTRTFSNGTISTREYVRALGRIDRQAGTVRELAGAMQTRAESVPQFNMKTQANTLRGKVVPLEGPVRDRIAKATRGEEPLDKVYVAASDSGIVLATIVDGTYVREIVRTDRRDPGASGQSSLTQAQNAMIEQYDWAWSNMEKSGLNSEFGTTNIYRMQFGHPHGRLSVYFDGGTEQVFKEVQYKQLSGKDSLPPGPGVSNASENLTLTVNRTYPGGPLRVQLTNATGALLDAQVTVAGEPVGRTHGDGVLWTLGPAEQFQVSATHDGTTINATATPIQAES